MSAELLESALRLAVPIWIAALGEQVVQRAGVINIGIEGLMLAAAFAAYAVGSATGSVWAGCGAAALAGLLLAGLFAWLCVVRRGDQIVAGMGINLFALGLTGAAFASLYRVAPPEAPAAPSLRNWFDVPFLGELTGYVAFALILTVAVAVFFRRTVPGLALRAVGDHARAADAEGVSVVRVRVAAVLFGGAMAGVAGSVLTLSLTHVFAENMTAGRGFVALAVVIFGGWHAAGTAAAAVFFGALQALQFRLQASGFDVAYPLWLALPYALTLLALAVSRRSTAAPAELGRPYQRE